MDTNNTINNWIGTFPKYYGGRLAVSFGNLINVGEWADELYDYDVIPFKPIGSEMWMPKKLADLATAEQLKSVSDKLDDFLAGSDTDGIINKWKELEHFLEGYAQTDNLAEILSYKADKTWVTDNTYNESTANKSDVNWQGAVVKANTAFVSDIYKSLDNDHPLLRWMENNVSVGNDNDGLRLISNNELLHRKIGTDYRVWDASNSNNYNINWTANTLNAHSINVSEISAIENQTLIRYSLDKENKTATGWDSTGSFLYNYPSGKYISIKDDGTPNYTGNMLYHSGNANRNSIDWATNRLTTSGITLGDFSNSSSSEQWIRVFISHSSNNGSSINSALLMIGRNWSHASEESYTFMVTVGYDGRASINQLSSSTGTQLFDKIRLLWKNGSIWYIDIHYTGTNSNDVFVSGSGCGNFLASPNPTVPEGYTAKEFKVWQNSVTSSNKLIVDSGIDTKLTFNNTDGEEYTNIDFREKNVTYANITADNRAGSRYLHISGIPTKVDSLIFAEGKSSIDSGGSYNLAMAPSGGNARGQFYFKESNTTPRMAGIGCYTLNGDLERLFIGWGESPWYPANSLSISSVDLRYKNQIVLTSENYSSYINSQSSDFRLKSNVKELDYSLDSLCDIPTVEFDMDDKHQIGTVAQDIQKVCPEIVSEIDDEGHLGVEYNKVAILALKACKLLREEINELKKEIAILKEGGGINEY